VRYLKTSVQQQVITEIEKIVSGVCTSYNATYNFDYFKGYPPLINHSDEAKRILETCTEIEEIKKAENIDPVMGGEDFDYYMQERPGAYFFTGAKKTENPYPHHHPKFDIDERALTIAAKTLIQAYVTYQNDHPVDPS